MVSLVKIILNLFQKSKIVDVRRLPPIKPLRGHILGLTLGLVLVATNIFLGFLASLSITNTILLFLFAIGTYLGGIFVIFTALLYVILSFFPSLTGIVDSLQIEWYLIGYVFGWLSAIFYNDLVYLFLNFIEKDKIKIAFAVDKEKEINIVKKNMGAFLKASKWAWWIFRLSAMAKKCSSAGKSRKRKSGSGTI